MKRKKIKNKKNRGKRGKNMQLILPTTLNSYNNSMEFLDLKMTNLICHSLQQERVFGRPTSVSQ